MPLPSLKAAEQNSFLCQFCTFSLSKEWWDKKKKNQKPPTLKTSALPQEKN